MRGVASGRSEPSSQTHRSAHAAPPPLPGAARGADASGEDGGGGGGWVVMLLLLALLVASVVRYRKRPEMFGDDVRALTQKVRGLMDGPRATSTAGEETAVHGVAPHSATELSVAAPASKVTRVMREDIERVTSKAKQAAGAVNGAVQGSRSTRKQRRHRRLKEAGADADSDEEAPSPPEPSPSAARRGKPAPAPLEYDF